MEEQGIQTSENSKYVLGNSEQILNKLATRTLQQEAQFLTPFLAANQTILDAGCGIGSITRDVALFSSSSEVHGIDFDQTQILQAQQAALDAGANNTHFSCQSITKLNFPDNFFDIVFAHTVFMHLPEPQKAMNELYRVCKPSGVIALREGVGSLEHFPSITIGPKKISLSQLLSDVLTQSEGTPDIGLRLKGLVHNSGFKQIQFSAQAVSYQTQAELQQLQSWYTSLILGRTGELALKHNLISNEDLATLVGQINDLPYDTSAVSIAIWGELTARKED